MEKTVRIWTGRMETRHGVDFVNLLDDPNKPVYTEKKAEKALLNELNCKKRKDGSYYYADDPDREAYFDCSYVDHVLPKSLFN